MGCDGTGWVNCRYNLKLFACGGPVSYDLNFFLKSRVGWIFIFLGEMTVRKCMVGLSR